MKNGFFRILKAGYQIDKNIYGWKTEKEEKETENRKVVSTEKVFCLYISITDYLPWWSSDGRKRKTKTSDQKKLSNHSPHIAVKQARRKKSTRLHPSADTPARDAVTSKGT